MTVTIPDNAESRDSESDREPPRPFHLGSYAHLLQIAPVLAGAEAESGARAHEAHDAGVVIDAIIVPTIRKVEELRSAVRLAKQLRCQLIALYTDKFPDGLSQALAEAKPGRATALALRSGAGHRLLDLASTIPQTRVSNCALDISRKRNLGLLIGRACGWTRILFLDDDIRRLNVDKVRSAAALLRQYPIVGFQVTKFPDASVIGHARRIAESQKKPFVSGGSMLVDPQRMRGFFPPVYHEDWLCIMDHVRLGEVAIADKVAQLRYHPFTTTNRAQLEEFGDILASGLLWLVHARRDSSTDEHSYWHEATSQQFWRNILQQRASLLDDLYKRWLDLVDHDTNTPQLKSIQAARERCDELTPNEFVSFITKWLSSLAVWRARLSDLPRADSVTKALAELGLLHVVIMQGERRSRVRSAARRIRSTIDVVELPGPVYHMGRRVPGLRRYVRAKPDL